MDALGTILGVWAHPDDEMYLSAAIMAMAVRAGSRVVCVTATRGEGGSIDETLWPSATLGAVRTRELLESLAILGVSEHVFLDLPDVDMETPLPAAGAARVRDVMADVRPDTVLTFGSDGMTGHAGHRSVSWWATDAFRAAAPPGSRLLYATLTPEWAETWLAALEPFGIYLPGTPPITPRDQLALAVDIPPDLLDLKMAAFRAHASQVGGLIEVFGEDNIRSAFGGEYFRLGAVTGGGS